jgi:dihydrolipoamide dehydrogenase
LSRLGVRVHLFGAGSKFGPISDPFINAEVKKIFEAELNVSSDARVDSAERTEQGVRVTYSEKGEQKAAEFACLLAATGRRSNVDELNLDAAGVILNERGMPAFNEATGQIEDKPLFLAGDEKAMRIHCYTKLQMMGALRGIMQAPIL